MQANIILALAKNVIPMLLVSENDLGMTTLLAWAKNQMILMLLDLESGLTGEHTYISYT